LPKTIDLAELVGKRFVTDFRVLAIGAGKNGEPEATLLMYGDRYLLSVDELEVIIERGLVTEAPERHL
jgi:hypothetical protein